MNYLVVGAGSAIGSNICKQLLEQGHQVIKTTRSQSKADSSEYYFDAQGKSEIPLPDIPLDGMVYLPGTITLKPFSRLTEQDFLKDFRINTLGAAKAIQMALPNLKKPENASIVLFSSVAASKGLAFHASIATAKSALEGLGLSLAAELAPQIRVNVIAPSLTDTPLASRLLLNKQRRDAAADRHPLKDIGKPQQIASLAVYLLSDNSAWMTGQVIAMDGGLSTVAVQ